MNPFGVILVVLGIVLIVIGVKGSQSAVLSMLKGVKVGQSSKYTSGAQATVNGILGGQSVNRPGAGGQDIVNGILGNR